jgi:hypothetical protein
MIFTVALALAALVLVPSKADAFNIANFKYTNSSLQAAAHPNVTISFDRQGGENEDLRDVLVDLPTGVFANPEAANPKCTATQFNADACPANSQVGTISTDVTALGLLPLTIPGAIFVLQPAANQTATLGMVLRPAKICVLFILCAQPQKIFLKTGITVRSFEDSGLRTFTAGTPKTATIAIPLVFISPTIRGDITIKRLSLTFQSRANKTNSGPYFWTQTGSCLPATARADITSYQGVHSTASSTYTPTGCPNVPFDPSFSFSVANNTSEASTMPTVTLGIPDADAPIQNALPKIVDIDFPFGSGIDLNALSGVTPCTDEQLRADTCPASSVIGEASAVSKYLPEGLAGPVYAMGVGNQIPIAVRVLGPRNTVVIFRGTLGTRGDANAGTGRVYATFDRIPQLPFRTFTLTLTKPLYKNPPTCGPNVVTAHLTGFNGTTATNGNGTQVTRTSTYNVVNCAAAPDTTITAGPPPITPDNTPTFAFTATTPGASFQCRFDANPYELCTSPFTPALPLPNGAHTFSVFAVNGLTPDPTPATYSFVVNTGSGYTITATTTPTTTQAAAHPDLAMNVTISGGQPRSVTVKLPRGFNASLAAVPLCSNANAQAGTCPASSRVGSAAVTVSTFGGPVSGVGDAFLTDAPTATDAGGIALRIPLSVGTFVAQAGAFLINNGNNQLVDIRDIPTTVGATAITVDQLSLNLSGANRFLTNPSNCAANDGFEINSVAYDGSNANTVLVPFQATGCATVPFNPSLTQTLTNPVAGQLSGVIANVDLPLDNSTIRTLRVTEPPALGPNFPAFGVTADQCPSSSAATPLSTFDPTGCPPQALVGTMDIETPLLPFTLSGDVYLINKSPLPWFGVRFDDPGISVRLVGVTSTPQVDPACDPLTDPAGFCQTQISAVFNNLPDVPLTHVTFTLNSPDRAGTGGTTLSGKLLTVATPEDPTCQPSSPARSTITPYTGTPAVNLTQSILITGCT